MSPQLWMKEEKPSSVRKFVFWSAFMCSAELTNDLEKPDPLCQPVDSRLETLGERSQWTCTVSLRPSGPYYYTKLPLSHMKRIVIVREFFQAVNETQST